MGFELRSVQRRNYFDCGWDDFKQLFKTGREYGWEPYGTVLDDYELRLRGLEDDDGSHKKMQEEWKGYYFSNDYQLVLEEDALNWREALERAMKDPHFLKSEGRPSMGMLREFMDFLADGTFRIM